MLDVFDLFEYAHFMMASVLFACEMRDRMKGRK